jgi:hypothetical protein
MPFFGPESAHWSQKEPIFTKACLFSYFLSHYKNKIYFEYPFLAQESPGWSQDVYKPQKGPF